MDVGAVTRRALVSREARVYALAAVLLSLLTVDAWAVLRATENGWATIVHLLPEAAAFAAALLLLWRGYGATRRVERVAEERRARAEELKRLALVAERTDNAVIITAADERIEWVNAGFTRITGYEPHEVIGLKPGRLLQGSESDAAAVARMRAAVELGEGFKEELINYTKGGDPYWLGIECEPIRGPGGELTGFIAIERDISERKEMERELRRLADRLSTATKGAEVGVWEYDVASRTLLWDETMCAIYGVGEPGVEGAYGWWRDALHPDDLERAEALLGRAIAGEDEFRLTFRIKRPDGATRWVDAEAVVQVEDGDPVRVIGINHDVTDRERATRDLVESERRFRELADHAPVMIWVSDLSGGRTYVNERWLEFTGRPASDQLGSGWFAGVHRDDRDRCARTYEHAFGARRPFHTEYRLRRADGEFRWITDSGTPRWSDDGEFLGMIGSCTDITERREMEEALRASERFATGTVDGLSAHVAVLDEHGVILAVNRLWERFAEENGARAGFGVGTNYLNVCDCADGACGEEARSVARGIRAVISGEDESFSYEYPCHSPSEQRWFVARVTRFAGDGPVRVVVAHENVTDRRLASDELTRSKQLLEQTGRLAGVGGWELDASTEDVRWTREVFRIFGHESEEEPTLEEALGHFPPVARRKIVRALEAARDRGVPFDMESPLITAGGEEIWVRLVGSPTAEDGVRRGIAGAISDITLARRAREELLAAREAAEDASRAKSEFLANMSHEIRTPMTAILGYAELLEDRAATPADIHDRIETIKRNGEHLLSVINDILDISRIEAGKLSVTTEPASPADVVHDVASSMLVRAAAKGLELDVRFLGPVPRKLTTDPLRLRQILINIVGNAVKFTEIGAVRLETLLDETPRGHELRIAVIDTGIGIAEEQLERVFLAFEQADTSMRRDFGGAGLGLCISSALAEMLGGRIEAESEPGRGSRFAVVIPVGPAEARETMTPEEIAAGHAGPGGDAAAARAADDAVHDRPPLAGTTVLLAEDGPDNQRLISFMLRKAGAVVELAGNGKTALDVFERAKADGEPVDMIVMDMQMPVLDGYEATRRLRRAGETLPIVALTAHAMTGDRERCLAAGCTDYATKPIDRAKLIGVCARLLRAGGSSSSSAA